MVKRIICIGGACIDYKLKSIHPLSIETSNPALSFCSYGGVARNVAVNLINMTNFISLQTVVGDDNEGKDLLKNLQKKAIDIDECLILTNQKTGRYYSILDHNGELHIACADMSIFEHIPPTFSDSWKNWPPNSIIFLDTNLSQQLIEEAIYLACLKNSLICIDPVSIAKSKKLPLSLENIYLIKPDKYEASAMTGIKIDTYSDCLKAGEILLNRGVQNVVISLGKEGYCIINENEQRHYSVPTVNHIKDVSGAGDAFIAGIIFGIQQELCINRACKIGTHVAIAALQSYETSLT